VRALSIRNATRNSRISGAEAGCATWTTALRLADRRSRGALGSPVTFVEATDRSDEDDVDMIRADHDEAVQGRRATSCKRIGAAAL